MPRMSGRCVCGANFLVDDGPGKDLSNLEAYEIGWIERHRCLDWAALPENQPEAPPPQAITPSEPANPDDPTATVGGVRPEGPATQTARRVGALKASVQVPSYISANAERGLAWNADGLGGDGLTDGTLREARGLAAGSVSDDKVRRMSAWFARHLVDLDRPQNSNPKNEDYPGPGAVAWSLWGGSPTNPQQAMDWADAKVAALDGAEE